MDDHRAQRVSEALREELGELITLELLDPRLQGVLVTDIHLSPDMKLASVRLSIPGDKAAQERALEAMQHAKSFIKRELALRLDLFRIPELRFEPDLRVEADPKMKSLLRRVRRGRSKDAESIENSEKSQ